MPIAHNITMAVHPVLRGGGVGAQVLRSLVDVARERGDQRVVLHAQRSAEGFYSRLGLHAEGEPFEEAGIPHITMSAALPLKR